MCSWKGTLKPTLCERQITLNRALRLLLLPVCDRPQRMSLLP